MKALSIKQPWLYAITDLDKRIENREWKPPQWIIGERIALHASKTDDASGYAEIFRIAKVKIPANLPRGCIVATARIGGFYDEFTGYNREPFGKKDKWFFGTYGWVLDDVCKMVEPIICKGALGLWDIPEELLVKLASRSA